MTSLAVAGMGYVGLSVAVLLAQRHRVVGVDIDEERVKALRHGELPIADSELEDYLAHRELDLSFVADSSAYAAAVAESMGLVCFDVQQDRLRP